MAYLTPVQNTVFEINSVLRYGGKSKQLSLLYRPHTRAKSLLKGSTKEPVSAKDTMRK